MEKNAELSEFQRLVAEIKTFYNENPNIKLEDRELITELMQVLRYVVEFNLLNYCFANNDTLNSVIADIDTKLISIDNERKAINEKINTMPLVDSTKRLVHLRMYERRLMEVRQMIITHDFDYYVKAMNDKLSNVRPIVDVCSGVLSSGKNGFNKLFGEDIVKNFEPNPMPLSMLYQILTDPSLRKELDDYLKKESQILKIETEIASNNKFIDYLNVASKNVDMLKEYMSARVAMGLKSKESETQCMSNIASLNIELNDLSAKPVSNVINYGKRRKIMDQINHYQNSLDDIREATRKKEQIEARLEKIGLGKVIACYGQDSLVNQSVENKVADFLKYNLRPTRALEVANVISKINLTIKQLEERKRLAQEQLEIYKTTLSFKANELLTDYYKDVLEIMNMNALRPEEGITPLLACYVLKALADAKNLSYEDVNDAVDAKVDTDKLLASYNAMINRTSLKLQYDLVALANEKEEVAPEIVSVTEDGPIFK